MVGGRGRLALPQLPRSATCRQALGGQSMLRVCVRLSSGTGNRGLETAVGRCPPCLVPGFGRTLLYLLTARPSALPEHGQFTHTPFPRCPHPVTALPAAFGLPLLERHPQPLEVSAHCFTSRLPRSSPRRSDATRWKLTRHTWAWQKIEPSWNFFFLNYTTLAKSKCSLQS